MYDDILYPNSKTLQAEKPPLDLAPSDNSGCLEDGIGNEFVNTSIIEQYNEIIESSTNLLKKKKSPKKVVISPKKLHQSVMAKHGKI
jgi:hypothetical protein